MLSTVGLSSPQRLALSRHQGPGTPYSSYGMRRAKGGAAETFGVSSQPPAIATRPSRVQAIEDERIRISRQRLIRAPGYRRAGFAKFNHLG